MTKQASLDCYCEVAKIPKRRGTALFEVLANFDPDFIAALELGQTDVVAMQDREPL